MQEAMRKLFCRIDANADGALDWDEFSLYMLLENSGAAAIRESSTSMQFVHGGDKGGRVPPQDAHRKIMDCISQIPACGGAGPRYVTGARDGTVKLWDHQVCRCHSLCILYSTVPSVLHSTGLSHRYGRVWTHYAAFSTASE